MEVCTYILEITIKTKSFILLLSVISYRSSNSSVGLVFAPDNNPIRSLEISNFQ